MLIRIIRNNKKISQDPSTRYQPECEGNLCSSGEPCGQGVSGNCKRDNNLKHGKIVFTSRRYRLSNPSCNLRGMVGIDGNGYASTHKKELKCHSIIISKTELSSKIITDLVYQHQLIQLLLPKGGELPCEPTNLTCAVITQPNSTHRQSADNIRKY